MGCGATFGTAVRTGALKAQCLAASAGGAAGFSPSARTAGMIARRTTGRERSVRMLAILQRVGPALHASNVRGCTSGFGEAIFGWHRRPRRCGGTDVLVGAPVPDFRL